MRASKCRFAHSISRSPSASLSRAAKLPRRMRPSLSSRASPALTSGGGSINRSASSDAVAGTIESSQPRKTSATHNGWSSTQSVVARCSRHNSSWYSSHSGTGGSVTSVSSASCSSSASRTTGQACSATIAIASASSAAGPSSISGLSVRRICTARARRSSSGASSR